VSDAWRCFVAVGLGDALRARLAASLATWRGRDDLAGLRWSDAESWHLTLAFLGDIEPATIDDLAAALRSVAVTHQPMRLRTGGLGGFPSASRARVAWYGVEDEGGRLRRLADDVGRAVDLVPDRPFTAHVTMARATHGWIDLRSWIAEADPPAGSLSIDRIALVRSHRDRGSGHYRELASVPLGPPQSASSGSS
jgi:2'-5' RNA ligase